MARDALRRILRRTVGFGIQTARRLTYALLSSNAYTGVPQRLQPLLAAGAGVVQFGMGVKIGVPNSPGFFSGNAYIEARSPNARVNIGSATWLNNNVSIIAEHSVVEIGSNCLLGYSVEIIDSDFHGLDPSQRSNSSPERAAPVRIGNNVLIGAHAKILKGVTVGDGSVIAHSSVVVRDVQSNTIVGGNPAKFIRLVS